MGLMKTSSLLSQLQEHQEERLSQSPYVSQDHLILPGPSEQEVGVASEIRQELANLTAVVITPAPPLPPSLPHLTVSYYDALGAAWRCSLCISPA